MLDPIRLSSFHQPAQADTDARPSSSGSELSLDHEEQNEGVVLFKSSTGDGMDQGWPTDRLSFYESLFPLAPETPPSLYHCQHSPRPELSVIPRSPKSNQSQAIEFFLKYHQREIVPALYFKMYDYQHFCKGSLPAMAAQSDALQHGLVSFSALIYSMKVNPAARYTAFYYYSVALKELCSLLNEESMTPTECNVAVATALQLATIDARSINSIANGSDYSAMRLNVFDTLKVLLVSFKPFPLRCDNPRPRSADRYWNGIAISRVIAAFSSLVNICFLAYGGTKMCGNDNASQTWIIVGWLQMSANRESWTICSRNSLPYILSWSIFLLVYPC